MATFVLSQRGCQKLVYEGHFYIKRRDRTGRNGQTFWRCERVNSKAYLCRARAMLSAKNVVDITGPAHNHPPRMETVFDEGPQDGEEGYDNPAFGGTQANFVAANAANLVAKQSSSTGNRQPQIEQAIVPKLSSLQKFAQRKRKAAKEGGDGFAPFKRTKRGDNIMHEDDLHSPVWNYFILDLDQSNVQCQLCPKQLQWNRNNKSLWDHLRISHKEQFTQLRQNQQQQQDGDGIQDIIMDLQGERPLVEEIVVDTASRSHQTGPKTRSQNSNQSQISGNFPNHAFNFNQSQMPQQQRRQPGQCNFGHQPSANRLGGPSTSSAPKQAERFSTLPDGATSHVLVWSSPTHFQNAQTFIMANVLDDQQQQVGGGGDDSQSGYTLAYVLHQKLGANAEAAACCYSTSVPVNIVLNEFSVLGYRVLNMVSRQPGELLWTLAKDC